LGREREGWHKRKKEKERQRERERERETEREREREREREMAHESCHHKRFLMEDHVAVGNTTVKLGACREVALLLKDGAETFVGAHKCAIYY
jgi:hypothetical protein